MKISPVTYTNHINTNKKSSNISTPDRVVYNVAGNNSPNFGRFIIDNIVHWGIKKMNQSKATQIEHQVREMRKQVLDDVGLLAAREGISREAVNKNFGDAIKTGGIPPKYDGKEVGLNKVVGYSLEKLEFLKRIVVPIMDTAKAKKTGIPSENPIKAPGGIILYGRSGSGKYFAAGSLLEHLNIKAQNENLPINTVHIKGEWWKGDTPENISALRNGFNEAKEKGQKGEHTVILIDRMNELFTAENSKALNKEFVEYTKDPVKDGFTWIGTVDDANDITQPFFNPQRTGLFVRFDKAKTEGESIALYQHFISQTNRECLFDQKYILDYTRDSEIPITPKKIKQIVKFADDELRMSEDYSTKSKGTYKAPIYNMQLMMGVDYVAKYNNNTVIKPVKKPVKMYIPRGLFVNDDNPFIENV